MYTSYIGKKFIALYSERFGKILSAKSFFDEVFFPLFFDDERHLLHVHGSTFFQKVNPNDFKNGETEPVFRLNRLHRDINNRKISGSTYVGYAAEGTTATTSGQVSSLAMQVQPDEMYASWIGEGLAIGVSGGFLMLIDEPEIFWALFEGWEFYRKFLQQMPNVKHRQIETWNGQWLSHRFQKNFNSDDPMEGFRIETNEVQGKIAIPTIDWSKVVFTLSKKYSKTVKTAYCYNLSQTNTTLGFVNIYLPQVAEMYEWRDKFFLNEQETVLNDNQIEKLSTFFNFREACKMGVIGLKALEPDKLRTYMPKGSVLYAQGKDFKFSDEESYFNYQLFKLWIIAMLNKTELLQLAAEVAKACREFEKPNEGADDRGKTTKSNLTQQLREASNLKTFIEKLSEVLEKVPSYADTFKNVVEQVIKMPSDNFPLFATLIRFEYQYQKSKNL